MFKLLIALTSLLISCNSIRPGPYIKATKGEVWPQPQQQQKTDNYFIIRPHAFSFKANDNIDCPNFIDDAFTRYWKILAASASLERRGRLFEVGRKAHKFWKIDEKFLGYLETLTVEVSGGCPEEIRPELGDNENYTLRVSTEGATLSAPAIWGVLRGLETFSQLIYLEQDALVINATSITDFPRFPHRGLLLDTARHFMPVYIILQTLDAMSYNKFNVFHWHLTDDQSFPFKSRTYPELSDKGAYHPVSKVYQQSDVSRIIECARLRGIRVIPEFDTPGHTSSWGLSHPELLTQCYTNNKPDGDLGPMDPTTSTTDQFMTNLFFEIVNVFPDSYVHIGGDEVDFTCWKSNPNISAFMSTNNITTYEGLQNYFCEHLILGLFFLGSKAIVWEEVFVNGASIPDSAVVHVWKGEGFDVLNKVTKAGKNAIFSSCWYLDHLSDGGDWDDFYECDALDFPGTDDQKKLVWGGEACMWSESVNEYNVVPRVWPRACATAEKLWSAENVNDTEAARPRLEEHTCRMNTRGIAAQPPNGPGVCL